MHADRPLSQNRRARRVTASTMVVALALTLTLGMPPALATTDANQNISPQETAPATPVSQSTESPVATPPTAMDGKVGDSGDSGDGAVVKPSTATPDTGATAPAPTPKATAPVPEATASPDPADDQLRTLGAHMGMSIGAGQQPDAADESTSTGRNSLLRAEPLAGEAQALAGSVPAGVPGIDVSGYQASPLGGPTSTVNWTEQWNLGVRFAYAKATEGISMVDASFSSQYIGASRVGMLRGAYHFARPNVSSATAQANFFVDNGGGWSADGKSLPPLLDMEGNPYGASCYGLSQSAMVAWIKAFSNQVAARTGRLPMIYTTYYWWLDCTGNSTVFTKQPLHIAAYGASTPWLMGGWKNYSVWQFSDSGPYVGDSNVWNGTLASLTTFARGGSTSVPKPSIPSPADVVAADNAGALWDYPATGQSSVGTRKQIGSGWTGFRSITVIDWNSDGVFDLLAQSKAGQLSVYFGRAAGGFNKPVTLAASGWQNFQLTVGYWMDSSPYPQILTRSSTGDLALWRNPSGGVLGSGSNFSHGWTAMDLVMLDFDGDGHQDLLARNATGSLILYRSNGAGGFIGESRPTVKTGWSNVTSMSVATNFSPAAAAGLIVRTSDGRLQHYPVPGNKTFGAATAFGSGWSSMLIAGGETIAAGTPVTTSPATPPSIRSAADLLTLDSSGTLWRSPVSGGKLGARTKVPGTFKNAVSVHNIDWNKDGTQDVLLQTTGGQILLYAGKSGGGFNGAVAIGSSGWADADIAVGQWVKAARYPGIVARLSSGKLAAYSTSNGSTLTRYASYSGSFARMHPVITDFDGNGNADLLMKDNIGQLRLFPSDGKGAFTSTAGQVVGNGWNIMSSVSAVFGLGTANGRGLLARTTAGDVKYYPIASSHFGTASTKATGWDALLLGGSRRLTNGQALTSVADTAVVDGSGRLWNYPAGSDGTISQPYQIGTGWKNALGIQVTDWNNDGVPDLVGRWKDGRLTMYPGRKDTSLGSALTIGPSGWSGIKIVVAKWGTLSGYPDVIGVDASGRLRHWTNAYGKALANSVQIGSGWSGLKIAVTDFSSDGSPDVLAVNSEGQMHLYRGNGRGGFVGETRAAVGSGWNTIAQFAAVDGFAGPSSLGLMARTTTGEIRYYPFAGDSRWGKVQVLESQIAGVLISN